MTGGWIVRQQPTSSAKHLCPDCGEEAAFVTVIGSTGRGMTALMCPACNGAFPLVLQVQS